MSRLYCIIVVQYPKENNRKVSLLKIQRIFAELFNKLVHTMAFILIATCFRPEDCKQKQASKVEVPLSPVAYLMYARSSVIIVLLAIRQI